MQAEHSLLAVRCRGHCRHRRLGRRTRSDCRNGNEARDVRDRWLRWWSEADEQLRILFADGDVVASLYVSQARVRDVNLGTMPYGLLNHEIEVWLERFTEMVDELVALNLCRRGDQSESP